NRGGWCGRARQRQPCPPACAAVQARERGARPTVTIHRRVCSRRPLATLTPLHAALAFGAARAMRPPETIFFRPAAVVTRQSRWVVWTGAPVSGMSARVRGRPSEGARSATDRHHPPRRRALLPAA